MRLSPIIFFHNHTDPASFDAIAKAWPQLSAMGYKALGLEFDSDLCLEDLHKKFEKQRQLARIIQGKLGRMGVTADSNAPQVLKDELETQETLQLEGRNIDQLLHLVRYNRIAYQNIDLPGINREPAPSSAKDDSDEMHARNVFMAKKMLKMATKHKGGVVFFVGAMHNGIQKLLMNSNSKLAKRFQSMYIGSYENSHKHTTQFECLLKSTDALGTLFKLAHYPLGITVVDSKTQNAAAAIVRTAKKHQIKPRADFFVRNWQAPPNYHPSMFDQPKAPKSPTIIAALPMPRAEAPTADCNAEIASKGVASLAHILDAKPPVAELLSLSDELRTTADADAHHSTPEPPTKLAPLQP